MKISEYEKEITEADIQRFSQMPDENGRPLLSPKDAIMIRQIDDYKLRCIYLDETLNKNRQKAAEDKEKVQQKNIQDQQQTLQMSQQGNVQLEQLKQQGIAVKNANELQLALLNGIIAMRDTALTQGVDIPETWKPVEVQLVSNVMMPVVAKNQQMQTALQQGPPPQQGQPQEQDPSQQPQQMPQGQPPQ